MDRLDAKSSLCHHKSCNGRVDSARQKQHSVTAGAYGKSSCRSELSCVNVSRSLADLDLNDDVGVSHVDLDAAVSSLKSADFADEPRFSIHSFITPFNSSEHFAQLAIASSIIA